MLAGKMAKLGILHAIANEVAIPNRPLLPLAKPILSAKAMPMGSNTTARPTEDGMTKPSSTAVTTSPVINWG
ncbi:hypothetical protein GCM10007169_11740 [Shewanella fodinae]|nr:hypothetical protein GCM10007169_11740 [Shewanella fodinae]